MMPETGATAGTRRVKKLFHRYFPRNNCKRIMERSARKNGIIEGLRIRVTFTVIPSSVFIAPTCSGRGYTALNSFSKPLNIYNYKHLFYREANGGNMEFMPYFFPSDEWDGPEDGFYYPDIQCVWFEYCDRGIHCWRKFNVFLKATFPNLRALVLSQNWTQNVDRCNDDDERAHLNEFLHDSWLEGIFIDDAQSGLTITASTWKLAIYVWLKLI